MCKRIQKISRVDPCSLLEIRALPSEQIELLSKISLDLSVPYLSKTQWKFNSENNFKKNRISSEVQNDLFVCTQWSFMQWATKCALDGRRTALISVRLVVERKQNRQKYPCENLCLIKLQKRGDLIHVVYGTVIVTITIRGDPLNERSKFDGCGTAWPPGTDG